MSLTVLPLQVLRIESQLSALARFVLPPGKVVIMYSIIILNTSEVLERPRNSVLLTQHAKIWNSCSVCCWCRGRISLIFISMMCREHEPETMAPFLSTCISRIVLGQTSRSSKLKRVSTSPLVAKVDSVSESENPSSPAVVWDYSTFDCKTWTLPCVAVSKKCSGFQDSLFNLPDCTNQLLGFMALCSADLLLHVYPLHDSQDSGSSHVVELYSQSQIPFHCSLELCSFDTTIMVFAWAHHCNDCVFLRRGTITHDSRQIGTRKKLAGHV